MGYQPRPVSLSPAPPGRSAPMYPSTLETSHVLSLQAGALVALALALAAALARAAAKNEARAAALLADNERLRSELVHLKKAAGRGQCAEAAACASHLAATSQEMRLPIRGVLDMADLLLEGRLAPEHASYAQAIHGSGAALLGLIDNLPDAPGIEAERSDRGDPSCRRELRNAPSQSMSRAS